MDLLLQTLGSGEGPDNADNDGDMVKELFAKFNNPTVSREEELEPQSISESSVTVEIPVTSTIDLSQYEFLPGHFDVRYVISESSEADAGLSYQVKLQSGETETVGIAWASFDSHFSVISLTIDFFLRCPSHNFSPSRTVPSLSPTSSTTDQITTSPLGQLQLFLPKNSLPCLLSQIYPI